MSNNQRLSCDELLKQAEEKRFSDNLINEAAYEIHKTDLTNFISAQSDDISDEDIKRLSENIEVTVRKEIIKKKARDALKRISSTAAMVLLAGSVFFTAAYVTVDAARVAINDFFLETFGDHVEMWWNSKEDSGAAMPYDWDGAFIVGWVPKRYEKVEYKVLEESYTILYYTAADENDKFVIETWVNGTTMGIDNEEIGEKEEIKINEGRAIWIEKEDKQKYKLMCEIGEMIVSINGLKNKEECVKIANTITS